MKKWRVAACIFAMEGLLMACGRSEGNMQSAEQESVVEVSEPEAEETEEPEENAENGTEENHGNTPAVVNIETVEQEYKEGELLLMSTACDKVSVVIEGNEEAADLIMERLTENEKAFQESVAETLEWAEENRDMIENTAAFYQDYGYTVTRNDGSILSFSYNTSGYEGGAHGYYLEYGLNFDLATGRLLTIADVAADKAAFQEICVQEMLRQCEDLRAEGILFDEDMIIPGLKEVLEGKMEGEEWYFTEDGIRFISNIYEIAPYAAGKITFDIPYEMIDEVLKEK